MLTVGLFISVGPGNFDFEFSLSIADDLELNIGAHADIPVPRLPTLSPNMIVGALSDPEAALTNVGQQVIEIFDPSKAHFSISAAIDISGIKRMLIKIMEEMIGFAVDTVDDIADGFNAALDDAGQEFAAAQQGVWQQGCAGTSRGPEVRRR